MHKGWEILLFKYQSKLKKCNLVTPQSELIFAPFSISPKNVKVVIIGTRKPHASEEELGYPYFNKSKTDKTMLRIINCIENSFSTLDRRMMLDLDNIEETWKSNGVLMIHSYIPQVPFWKDLVIDILEHLAEVDPYITYFLWGENRTLEKHITGNILSWTDPSIHCKIDFRNCDNFIKLNSHLKKFSLDKYDNIKSSYGTEFNWVNKNETKKCICFTDGSYVRIRKKASYACYFPETICNFNNAISGSINEITEGNNIDAEGKALLICFDVFARMKYNNINCEYIVVTDSEFWINVIKEIYTKLKDKTQNMKDRFDKYLNMMNITIYFIPSHGKKSNIPINYYNLIDDHQLCLEEFRKGNSKADSLATMLTS